MATTTNDIGTLRRTLALGPYETLTFGAPDTTGWANLEVNDTRTGDFRVVGQYKAGAFRPAGASEATQLHPTRGSGRVSPASMPTPISDGEVLDALGGYVSTGGILFGGIGVYAFWGQAHYWPLFAVALLMFVGGVTLLIYSCLHGGIAHWAPSEGSSLTPRRMK